MYDTYVSYIYFCAFNIEDHPLGSDLPSSTSIFSFAPELVEGDKKATKGSNLGGCTSLIVDYLKLHGIIVFNRVRISYHLH
jgi:hypothetical protein